MTARAKPKSKPDPEADAFIRAVEVFRDSVAEATSSLVRRQHRRTPDAKTVLAHAESWVYQSGVGLAACQVYEMTRRWPAG